MAASFCRGIRSVTPPLTLPQRRSRQSSSPLLPSMVNRVLIPVKLPAVPETVQFGPALLPANLRGMRPFGQPPLARAKLEIAPHVIHPPEQDRAGPVDFPRRAAPDRSQGASLAEGSLEGLVRRVIVRVHDHGLRAIH